MASISLKKGIWYLWISQNGKSKGISLKTKDQGEALKRAARFQQSNNEQQTTTNIHLTSIFSEWKSWNTHLSKKYIDVSSNLWAQLVEQFRDLPIDQITSRDLMLFLAKRRKKGDTETYLEIRMRTYKAIFNWALKQELSNNRVFDKIEMPKGHSRIEFLSKGEINMLLKAAEDNLLYRAFIEFMLATGCRRGELYNLKWLDINDNYIEFNGKTGRRTFPLKSQIKSILDNIEQIQQKQAEFVFSDIHGKHFNRVDTISKFIKRYMRKAGLKESYVAHSLRHTFASHLVINGTPIYTVSKLLGHSSVHTTEKYSHLAPDRINVDITYF